jgi:hypothetical protein
MSSSFNQAIVAASNVDSQTSTVANNKNTTVSLIENVDDPYIRVQNALYDWIDDYEDNDYSYVDDLKNIRTSVNQINITQEENSQVIPFELPRYYDGIDLTNMTFQIHYVNANGYDGLSVPINVVANSEKIRFYWLADASVCAVKGYVEFEIIASGTISTTKGDKNYVWKTRPNKNSISILESLSGNGAIEPSQGWDTYLQQVSNLVNEANSYVESARQAANQAQAIANTVDEKVSNVSDDITSNVKSELAITLQNYYTKSEVDQIINNMDFSNVLEEVQNKIDAIDGLANLKVDYDSSTNIMLFKNGEELIVSHELSTNPTSEWTSTFKSSLKTDIDNTVGVVSDALNEYKTSNDETVTQLQKDISNTNSMLESNYYTSTQIDEKLKDKVNSTDISSIQSNIDQIKSSTDTNKSNITAISSKLSELEEQINNANTDPTVHYRHTYDPETGLFQLIEVSENEDGTETETVVSASTIVGGGGGGSTSTTITIDRITTSPVTITKNDKAIIKYNFSSVDSSGDDTGEGTAVWKLGNTIIATTIAIQGENTFDATEYISVGTQKLTLTITDAAGAISVKTWTVQMIDVRIESSFNDRYTYPIGTIAFDYTPYGSIEKTVHFVLGGKEIGTVVTSSSGLPMSYTLPEQTHGAHLLDVYITAEINNSTIETNHIYKDILWYDSTSDVPVIGCIYQNFTAMQYDSTNIIYTVYDPNTESPKVTLSVDGVVTSTLTLDSPTQTWQFKSDEIGPHVLTIQCRDVVKTINVTIEKLNINVEPVTANLAFDFNPTGRSNNDENKLWYDENNSTVAMTVSDNFDWVNGGYQLDSNGDQYFCVKAGTSATFSYNLFADDARKNGKEFKLIFKTENVSKSNATFLTCQTDNPEIGLQMNVHEAYVRSSVDKLYIPYSEEDIIEFEFNIFKDTEIPLVLSYEDGTPGRPMIYTSDHTFTQTTPVPIIIGSNDCDVLIYRMKAYSSSLTDSGVLSNYIADARNATEMISRYTKNQIYDENNQLTPESAAKACPDKKVIKIECPHFTNDKKDFVKDTSVECIHTGGDPVLDNWKAINCYHSGQGTTSNEYGYAGRNLDLLMCFDGVYTNSKITYDENYKTILTMGDGTRYEDGTGKITLTRNSVPTNYCNIKVNIASSENENNAKLQKRYNDYLPYTSVAQKKNPNVKNTMEFVDCIVFLKESDPDLSTHREFQDCEWHFYALGNIGDSKKTDYTRVADVNDPNEFVVEIMDNTLPNSTFSGTEEALAALDADKFDEKGTYGFRYEIDGITDEQHQANMAKWREFYRFVSTSTDEEFVSGLKNWFIVDSALYFYLFTERYTMIDNRAKNTFWHYSKVYISKEEAEALGEDAKYYTIDDEAAAINNGYRFELWNYDNDTGLGINNSGELTMTYGKEDTDYRTDGDPSSGYIFNAAESKFFCRIRDLMHDELVNMFLQCESKGAWSAEGLINQFDEAQSSFPEELWRIDYIRKYRRTYEGGTPRFLVSMMNGKKKYQRRQFERDQEKYIATKYFGTTATSDQIMFRCNTPVDAIVTPNYTLHLTPYSDMYLSVMFGATYRTQIRAKAGVQYDIECPFETMDDTAVLIYCASRIQSLGDVSACYIHDNDFSKAVKLKELIIGNDTAGYSNGFLTNLNIGNNVLLEYLNIKNTPNLVMSLNLTGCPNLLEFYAEGSGLTGVSFANGGKIRIAHIPAVTSLTVKNLSYITDLQLAGFENLRTLTIENTPAINSYEYITSSPALTNVRLIGIDWGTDEGIADTSILDRLINIAGIDNNGYNSLVSVLSGNFYSPIVKQNLLADYTEAWPDLIISYSTLIIQFTATFMNDDGTILDVQYVDKGEYAVDPITRDTNPIDIPTKESTVSTDFTFDSWDIEFVPMFSNKTYTATYSEKIREYTVRYLNHGVVLYESSGPYGSIIQYVGDVPVYTEEEPAYNYYLFSHWDKSGYIDGNKDINAIFDSFEYTDGCFDDLDISDMRPVQIYALKKLGKEQTYVQLKDSISFNMGIDYHCDDISEVVLISDKTVFSGSNYIDTKIDLLNIDKDWTLAVDYKWSESNTENSVLMQCYQGDGSNGFKLWYSSQYRVTWGTSSTNSSGVNDRDMLVMRHKKGDTQIHVYRSNLSSDNIEYSTLKATRSVAGTQTLVFGCARADDGVYENYAIGTVYWSKLWYSDLGDSVCRDIAAWTHENITLEMSGFRKYYLSDGSGSKTSMTFLGANLLENQMILNKNSSSNDGGWANTSLKTTLNNRFYNAIPIQWRQLLKQCKIPSTAGNKSSETITSDCYITIPAIVELDSSYNREPYNYEGTVTPFITSDATRARYTYDGVLGSYWTRSPNTGYSTYFISISGDNNSPGYVDGYSYATYKKYVLIELSI